MFIGEVILALVAYPLILLAPGLLWTFLFNSINSRMGIIKRLLVSVVISISTMPLLIFSMNRFLDVPIEVFSVSILLIIVAFFPFLISLINAFFSIKPDIQKPVDILNEIKSFIPFTFLELKKALSSRPHIILFGILVMGILLTLFPHFGYGLPIHTDEWHYMAYADNLITLESIELQMPYSGWEQSQHWEIGFIIFIALVKMLSGVSWPFLFYTLPAVIFSMVMLTSYKLGQKHGFGLHSAFLVALVPSTLRFLGPVFLVPISLGILLILFSTYLVIGHSNRIRYLLLFSIMAFTFIVHPPSGGYLFIILFAIFLIDIIRKEKAQSLYLGVTLLFFILGVFLLPQSTMNNLSFSSLLTSGNFFLPMFDMLDFVELISYIPMFLAVLGIGFLYKQKEKHTQKLLASLIMLILFVLTLYYVFPHFYQIQAVYDRALILLAAMIAIVAGAGIFYVQKNVSQPLFIVLVSCVLVLSLSAHSTESYYHIISESEYDDFVWIRENLNSSYDEAILDPWKAIAFTPVTGKQVYYRIPQGPNSNMDKMIERISEFFSNGCIDTAFLESNGIDIVYTHGICNNPDLQEVRTGVYIFNASS